MDCFPDYCLACDKQITDGLYCSQTCRLADLERSGSTPTSTSPLTPSSISFASASWTASPFSNVSTLHLAPAFDFASHSSTTHMDPPSSVSRNNASRSPRPAFHHTNSAPTTPCRNLTPSSSRSSLSSNGSATHSRQPSDGLSEEAKHELKGYFDSFDTRERRRRSFPAPHQIMPQPGMTPIYSYEDEQ